MHGDVENDDDDDGEDDSARRMCFHFLFVLSSPVTPPPREDPATADRLVDIYRRRRMSARRALHAPRECTRHSFLRPTLTLTLTLTLHPPLTCPPWAQPPPPPIFSSLRANHGGRPWLHLSSTPPLRLSLLPRSLFYYKLTSARAYDDSLTSLSFSFHDESNEVPKLPLFTMSLI